MQIDLEWLSPPGDDEQLVKSKLVTSPVCMPVNLMDLKLQEKIHFGIYFGNRKDGKIWN